MKTVLKLAARGAALALVFPFAILSAFGRLRPGFSFCAELCALFPGLPGDYLRGAFYRLTLASCAWNSRISFGTFFSTPDVVIEDGVYIGAYCVIGRARIGRRTQIASHVQILSGARQHGRDEHGNLLGAEHGVFQAIAIGSDSWIGAGAIVMADVGQRTTVGAGAIVTRTAPDNSTVVGNPARVLGSSTT